MATSLTYLIKVMRRKKLSVGKDRSACISCIYKPPKGNVFSVNSVLPRQCCYCSRMLTMWQMSFLLTVTSWSYLVYLCYAD